MDSLLTKRLVVETGTVDVSRGRKPHLVEVNPQLATFLGLEVDQDRVTAVVVDMAGTLLGRGAVR
ncbi:MAG: hypothetical protein Q8L69_15625, partial [Gallionellaceae bacterium]|nr:hypothetical protein [Gallionellaceae bacterium]